MFNGHALEQQIKVADEMLEWVEEYISLAQTVTADQVHEREINRIGMGWMALGKQISIRRSN